MAVSGVMIGHILPVLRLCNDPDERTSQVAKVRVEIIGATDLIFLMSIAFICEFIIRRKYKKIEPSAGGTGGDCDRG